VRCWAEHWVLSRPFPGGQLPHRSDERGMAAHAYRQEIKNGPKLYGRDVPDR